MSNDSLPEVYTDAASIRRRFAELRLQERLALGEIKGKVVRQSVPLPGNNQPAGTIAQIVFYYEGETRVAIVHQYLLIDGTLGASGLPDPKWLLDGETILKVAKVSRSR